MKRYGLLFLMLLASWHVSAAGVPQEQIQFFENQVRPLLVERCYECHSADADEPEGGLRLDSLPGWQRGGDSGQVVVPGNPDESKLIEAVSYRNVDLQMPPDEKLSDDQITLLVKWVELGAPDPRTAEPVADVPEKTIFDLASRRAEHWCWQPLARTMPPTEDGDWSRKDSDRYLLARMIEAGLSPAPAADKRTFIRRATFDLIGLPPTPTEVHAFLADHSAQAYEKLIDRLLESPHFGEHWGQHWLDLMRFAETRGHEQDYAIPAAFRYRDYVIQAFNEDIPYNQFVVEHVAGDLLEQPRVHPIDRTNQSIQGTGFWHLHEASHSPVDIQGDEAARNQNQIDVFSRAFLGLSMGCARCHDHKFDAISTRDYYAMYGYLQSSSFYLADISDPARRAEIATKIDALNERHEAILRPLIANQVRKQTARLSNYLSAAIQFHESVSDEEVAAERIPESLCDFAKTEQLNSHTLWNLIQHLRRAQDHLDDPLHVWARLMVDPHTSVRHISALLWQINENRKAQQTGIRAGWRDLKVIKSIKEGERNYQPIERAWTKADVIEDFSNPEYPHWITGGYRFGRRPAAPGDLLLGRDVARPVLRLLDQYAAVGDRTSTRQHGMLRTRTFEITADTIWYRFRGKGDLFLAVDSHRVVNGPLHGVVRQKLEGDANRWQWKSQKVRDYIGHRVHAEFTPGEEFAIERVLFAGSAPPNDNPLLDELVASHDDSQTKEVALQSLADRTVATFNAAADKLRENKTTAGDAALLNWYLSHAGLFEPIEQPELAAAVAKYSRKMASLEKQIPKPIRALTLLDGSGENEPVHIRGNHRNPSNDRVPRRILTALGGDQQPPAKRGSGRLDLAMRLVDPQNPLISRVYVNRIWYHLFGRGIVETVDDFGVMGKEPTHPELLDHLALKFMEKGWSTKSLIRDLMLSSAYRMSSYPVAEHDAADPTNAYLHRMRVRRLPAEAIRDHLLAVSGRLHPRMFGKSTMVHISPFMRGNRSPAGSGPLDGDGRRSIYTEVRRNHLAAFLVTFDKPVPFMAIGKRSVSNSPAQSLILLNDPLVHEQADLWAGRLLSEQEMDDYERLSLAYELAFARLPTDVESKLAMAFLEQQDTIYEKANENEPRRAAWRDLCHTLINVKEFIHIN